MCCDKQGPISLNITTSVAITSSISPYGAEKGAKKEMQEYIPSKQCKVSGVLMEVEFDIWFFVAFSIWHLFSKPSST